MALRATAPASTAALDVAIRPLRLGDAPAAVAVIHAAFAAQSVPTDPPSGALRETAASIAARIASGGGACAEARDGALAGVVLWAEEDDALYVGRLAVLPAWRRRGVASALVAAAADEARRCALPRLRVRVRLVLSDNRRLLASLGFCETAFESHPGHSQPTSVVMERCLG